MKTPTPLASVIIPTLRYPAGLPGLLELFAAHPRVGEIIVIDNGGAGVETGSDKVRVLSPGSNIYVNPAWNLGARESRHPYLVIANDDISIDPELISYGLAQLDRNRYPILGAHGSSLGRTQIATPKTRPAPFLNLGFGTLMFVRRSNYRPIPQELKIYGSDDWLFFNQNRPGATIMGFPVRTVMGTTSKRAEFDALRATDQAWFNACVPPILGSRPWHRALPLMQRAYDASASARHWLSRIVAYR